MVKLQLVEDSRPCRVVDSVKCRRVKPTVTMPQRLLACPLLLTEGSRLPFTSKGGVPDWRGFSWRDTSPEGFMGWWTVKTRNENSLAYHIPTTSNDYHKNSFFHHTVPDWNCQTGIVGQTIPVWRCTMEERVLMVVSRCCRNMISKRVLVTSWSNFFTGLLSSRLKQIHTRMRFFRKIWIYCVIGKPSRRWGSIPTSVKYWQDDFYEFMMNFVEHNQMSSLASWG